MTKQPAVGLEPWERGPDESSIAYAAFRHFLDAGDLRQLRTTAVAQGKHVRQIQRWAHDHRWHERVLAWDQYVARVDAAERRRQLTEMRRRHAGVGSEMLEKVREAVKLIEPTDLSPGNIVKWLAAAAQVERTALESGQPAASAPGVEMNVTIDQRSVNIHGEDRPELAEYLDQHPEKIPQVIAIVEDLLKNPQLLPHREEINVTPQPDQDGARDLDDRQTGDG